MTESRNRDLAEVLHRTGVGAWSWEQKSGRVEWDASVARMFGMNLSDFTGTFDDWAARIHPEDVPAVLEALERAMETRSALFFEHRCVWPDGSEHWLEARGYPTMNDVGEVTGAAGICIDIDSRMNVALSGDTNGAARGSIETAWDRLAQLQVIAVRLAGAAGVDDVARVLVDQGMTALGADGGFFATVNPTRHSLDIRAHRGAHPDVVDFYRDLSVGDDNPVSMAARTGEPAFVGSDEERRRRFPDMPHQGADAFLIQPILIQERVEAVLGYGFRDSHEFTIDEEELVATIAGMSVQALGRAQYHDSAERNARRSAQLEAAIAELAGAATPLEVADTVVESLIPAVGAQKGSLFMVDGDAGALVALAIHGYSQATVDEYRTLDLEERTGPTDVVRTASPLLIDGPEDFAQRYPHLAPVGVGAIPATSLMLPLMVENHVLGTLSLGWDDPHPFSDEELRHLGIVAGICAHALGRAAALQNWQEAHARLDSIDQITDAALSQLSLEDLLDVLPGRVAGAVGAVATRIFLLDDSGDFLEARGSYGAPLEELARVPVGRGLAGTIAATGEPQVVENIRAVEVVRPAFPDEVVWEAGVPLRADGKVIGVLDVGAGGSRPLTQADIELLERAGDRIATAISRSRTYELERASRRRSEFIGQLGQIMGATGTLDRQLEEMANLTAETLADCCVMAVLDDVGGVVKACAHVDPSKEPIARNLVQGWVYDRSAEGGLAAVIRSRRSQHYGTLEEDAIEQVSDEFVTRLCKELDLGSAIITPLIGVSGPVGAMLLGRTDAGPQLDVDDLVLTEDLAGRIASVIEGRVAFDRHRNTAVTLQQSLLPSRLPEIQGLDVAARYWPASDAAEVGGDFYDVVELGPDIWAVMVGDVSGKGVEASALTGIARHTARAAARHGIGPSDVLRWIHDAFLAQAETTDSFCTAVVGLLYREGDEFRFKFAVGGHPLPILHGKRRSTYIGEPGTVLGLVEPVQFTECQVTLQDDDRILIYTDGVTDVPVADAVTEEELLETVQSWDRLSSAEAVDALDQLLAARYGGTTSRDDTAVLLIRKRNSGEDQ